jgi:hypothetical protein
MMKTTNDVRFAHFAGFASFAKTILIVSLAGLVLTLSLMVFSPSGTDVSAQVGVDEGPWLENKTIEEGVIMGDGVVPGGPGFIMVSVFDFKPYYQNMFNTWEYLGPQVHNPGDSADTYLVAGLTLPHDATITKLTLYYLDNSGARNLGLSLTKNTGTGSSYIMATLVTDGTAVAYRTLSTTGIIDSTVDNQNNSYSLYLTLPPDPGSVLIVSNVRVDYEYTSYTPLIAK